MRRIVQRAILLSLLLGSGRSVGVRKAQSMREASRAWPSKQDFSSGCDPRPATQSFWTWGRMTVRGARTWRERAARRPRAAAISSCLSRSPPFGRDSSRSRSSLAHAASSCAHRSRSRAICARSASSSAIARSASSVGGTASHGDAAGRANGSDAAWLTTVPGGAGDGRPSAGGAAACGCTASLPRDADGASGASSGTERPRRGTMMT